MLSRLPAEERRVQLVQAALSRAERDGISAVTIRRVAEDAGVSLGVVHYCFESKEELMAAAIESIVVDLTAALRQAFAQAAAPVGGQGSAALRTLLHSGVRAMWETIEATPNLQLLTYEITGYALRRAAAGGNPSNELAARQYVFTTAEAVAFLEESARRTGTRWTRPVEFLARTSMAVLDGVVLRWLVDRESALALDELDEVIEMLVDRYAVG